MKKIFTLFAAVLIAGSMMAEVYSGTLTETLSWSVNTDDGTLVITGSGAMPADWITTSSQPWYNYASSIHSISLPDGLTAIGSQAFMYVAVQSIEIPDGVLTIGLNAFRECRSMVTATIANSVTTLGNYAFYSAESLTTVTLGDGLTSVGKSAFKNCYSLATITCTALVPPTCGANCFDEIPANAVLLVPASSVSAYQAAAGWSQFANIQAISPTSIENTAASVKAQKIIENGQVIILRDGVRYNAVGAKL